MQKLSFFNTNFQNPFQDVIYHRILVCQNIVILKWRPFKYMAKFEKRRYLFRSEISIFDIFLKRMCKERFENLQINRNSKF